MPGRATPAGAVGTGDGMLERGHDAGSSGCGESPGGIDPVGGRGGGASS